MDDFFAANNDITILMQKNNKEIYFKIVLNDVFEEIGHIVYSYENSELMGNLFYFIYEEYRNKGYAKEALKLVIENIRKIVDKDLYLSIGNKNIASIKVAISSGATYYKSVYIPKNYLFVDDSNSRKVNIYKIKTKK